MDAMRLMVALARAEEAVSLSDLCVARAEPSIASRASAGAFVGRRRRLASIYSESL
jgi:hypothetical protein